LLNAGIALKGYFAGKRDAEAAVAANFPSGGVVIGPSFIYGGDSFVVSPPRVPAGYGGAIEGLLSNGDSRCSLNVPCIFPNVPRMFPECSLNPLYQ
jgi:hypothetical protein